MESGHNNRILIVVVVLILCAFFAYSFFFKTDTPAEGAVLSVESERTIVDEFSTLLTSLKKINLQGGILADNTFLSLVNSNLVIIPFPSGRTNPFAPLGL